MSNLDRLREIATNQDGFFTATQALSVGYHDSLHVYHVREGHWEKAARGIYRLVTIPRPAWPELVIWSLWSRDRSGRPQGVYAGVTALQIHGVFPRGGGPLHMMVPGSFRKNCETPKGLHIIKGDLAPADIEQRRGYRVVTLRKARAQAEGVAVLEEGPQGGLPRSTHDYDAVIRAGED